MVQVPLNFYTDYKHSLFVRSVHVCCTHTKHITLVHGFIGLVLCTQKLVMTVWMDFMVKYWGDSLNILYSPSFAQS